MSNEKDFRLGDYRYFVDTRGGLCAIIDTHIKKIWRDYLEPTDPNVVKFWEGQWDEEKEFWYLPIVIEAEARKLCKELNEEYSRTKEHKDV